MARCPGHGGGNVQSRDASDRRLYEKAQMDEVQRILNIEGFESVVNPYGELALLAGEVLKVKDVFREKVEELTNLKDVGGDKVATQIDVLVSAYERALDRSERLLLGVSRLDLDARIASLMARVDEKTAELVSSSLSGALSSANLPSETYEQIMQEFGRRLRNSQPAVPALAQNGTR